MATATGPYADRIGKLPTTVGAGHGPEAAQNCPHEHHQARPTGSSVCHWGAGVREMMLLWLCFRSRGYDPRRYPRGGPAGVTPAAVR
jgi:hypothetical protein